MAIEIKNLKKRVESLRKMRKFNSTEAQIKKLVDQAMKGCRLREDVVEAARNYVRINLPMKKFILFNAVRKLDEFERKIK